jgi:hypothetical protein
MQLLRVIDLGPLLGLAAVSYGLGRLQELARDRTAALTHLDAAIAHRRRELEQLLAEQSAAYPHPADVDPLHRAEQASPVPDPLLS